MDNPEIDIELLGGRPNVLFLTAWTDCQESPERFRKWSRSVDLVTGEYLESVREDSYDQPPGGVLPAPSTGPPRAARRTTRTTTPCCG